MRSATPNSSSWKGDHRTRLQNGLRFFVGRLCLVIGMILQESSISTRSDDQRLHKLAPSIRCLAECHGDSEPGTAASIF